MTKFTFIYGLCTLFLFASCEKEIDVNLNSTNKKLVVEAVVTNNLGPHTVLLSETADFSSTTEFNGVKNALVIISDDLGTIDTLQQTEVGVYKTSKISGIPGHKYYLQISYNDINYTSSSTMPELIEMDSLKISEEEILGKKRVTIVPTISDPQYSQNYYRFKLYQNFKPITSIFAGNDQYFNGISRDFNLSPGNFEEAVIKKGDTFQLELMCIDESVYNYFFTLEQTLDGNSASPANPKSNIQGGCLGYFSAHSTSMRTIVYE